MLVISLRSAKYNKLGYLEAGAQGGKVHAVLVCLFSFTKNVKNKKSKKQKQRGNWTLPNPVGGGTPPEGFSYLFLFFFAPVRVCLATICFWASKSSFGSLRWSMFYLFCSETRFSACRLMKFVCLLRKSMFLTQMREHLVSPTKQKIQPSRKICCSCIVVSKYSYKLFCVQQLLVNENSSGSAGCATGCTAGCTSPA